MNTKLLVAFSLLLCIGCNNKNSGRELTSDNENPGKVGQNVIYGADNRADLYQIQDPALLAVADSTVALVQATDLSKAQNGNFILAGGVFGNEYGLAEQ